jgi:hypothetical protein
MIGQDAVDNGVRLPIEPALPPRRCAAKQFVDRHAEARGQLMERSGVGLRVLAA